MGRPERQFFASSDRCSAGGTEAPSVDPHSRNRYWGRKAPAASGAKDVGHKTTGRADCRPVRVPITDTGAVDSDRHTTGHLSDKHSLLASAKQTGLTCPARFSSPWVLAGDVGSVAFSARPYAATRPVRTEKIVDFHSLLLPNVAESGRTATSFRFMNAALP
jgi:hypothetical protein